MLARFGRVTLPPPGGDVIGRRRVDTHFLALEQLGAEITVGNAYTLEGQAHRGRHLSRRAQRHRHRERPDGGRRRAGHDRAAQRRLRAARAGPGAVSGGLRGADRRHRHEHDDRGGRSAPRAAPYTIGPDYIEIGSFIGLAAVTNGAVTIEGVRASDLRATLLAFERLGVHPRLDGTQLIVDADQERRIRSDLGGHVPKLEDGPWPAFPADLMSIAIVVATQCDGLLLVFEKMFESRLFFVDKLIGMGARVVLCDPHRAVIAGPSPLRGQVVESPDIRAGMGMLLAALAAQGDSVIHNIGQIERGYERIDERLRALGAQIERRERAGDGWPGRRVAMSGPALPTHPPSRLPAYPTLTEQPAGDASVPRLELREWADRFGLTAGITTRHHGFALGLWSDDNVGQVMTRWRAFHATVATSLSRRS